MNFEFILYESVFQQNFQALPYVGNEEVEKTGMAKVTGTTWEVDGSDERA